MEDAVKITWQKNHLSHLEFFETKQRKEIKIILVA